MDKPVRPPGHSQEVVRVVVGLVLVQVVGVHSDERKPGLFDESLSVGEDGDEGLNCTQ